MDDIYIENPDTQEREKRVKAVLREETKPRIPIGKIPVMLRSKFCQLKKLNEH